MNGSGVLLDSVIVIDHFNAIPAATAYLGQIGASASISVITRAEVLTGFEGQPRDLARRLLDCFPLLVIDREVADLAAELRRLHRWKLPDAFQAALAQRHSLSLATRNTDDFDPDRHPFVVVPYVLEAGGSRSSQ